MSGWFLWHCILIFSTVIWLSRSQAVFSSKLANFFLNSPLSTGWFSTYHRPECVPGSHTFSEVKIAPLQGSEVLQGSNLQARQWLFTDLCLPSPKAVTTPFASFSLLVQQPSELEQLTSSAAHLPFTYYYC